MAQSTLPLGNLSAGDIDSAMPLRTCGVVCVTLVNFFETNWDAPEPTGRAGVCFRPRSVISSVSLELTNETITSWDWDELDYVWDDEAIYSLSDWFDDEYWYGIGTSLDYFLVSPETRASCFQISPPIDEPPRSFYPGNAAPPPPPPPKKMCCDCNTIATIIAENAIAELRQHEATRDHIDRRTVEAVRQINKMLQGMQFNINLQPVIDRLNELEANLWNGLKGAG